MAKQLIVNPNNETFAKLMRSIAKAIRTGNTVSINKIKAEFAEYDTTLFYNDKRDEIRVVIKDCPFVDFPVSQFTDIK